MIFSEHFREFMWISTMLRWNNKECSTGGIRRCAKFLIRSRRGAPTPRHPKPLGEGNQ